MRAYRLLGEEELNLILEGRTSALGEYFSAGFSNTHRYKKRERYMHFFFKREDCEYIKKIQGKVREDEPRFVAEFNIPLKKIIGHIGRGFYYPKQGGYDYDHDTCYEIALPVSIFSPYWLRGYEKVNENKMTTENQPE